MKILQNVSVFSFAVLFSGIANATIVVESGETENINTSYTTNQHEQVLNVNDGFVNVSKGVSFKNNSWDGGDGYVYGGVINSEGGEINFLGNNVFDNNHLVFDFGDMNITPVINEYSEDNDGDAEGRPEVLQKSAISETDTRADYHGGVIGESGNLFNGVLNFDSGYMPETSVMSAQVQMPTS